MDEKGSFSPTLFCHDQEIPFLVSSKKQKQRKNQCVFEIWIILGARKFRSNHQLTNLVDGLPLFLLMGDRECCPIYKINITFWNKWNNNHKLTKIHSNHLKGIQSGFSLLKHYLLVLASLNRFHLLCLLKNKREEVIREQGTSTFFLNNWIILGACNLETLPIWLKASLVSFW